MGSNYSDEVGTILSDERGSIAAFFSAHVEKLITNQTDN